jgi:hypothetical protein
MFPDPPTDTTDGLAWVGQVFTRDPMRWETEFGRWVADFGASRIVAALGRDPDLSVAPHAPYDWLRGHPPRPDRATALVELSEGRLSLDAIYNHSREIEERAHRLPHHIARRGTRRHR